MFKKKLDFLVDIRLITGIKLQKSLRRFMIRGLLLVTR